MEDMMEAMMAPYKPEEAKEVEVETKRLTTDSQLLVAIFEKVVCIEEKLKGGHTGITLPTSTILEGEM